MKLLSPARLRDFLPVCPPARPRSAAFVVVAIVAMALLAHGVPGGALPAVLLALAVLTVVVSGGQAPDATTAARAVAAFRAPGLEAA